MKQDTLYVGPSPAPESFSRECDWCEAKGGTVVRLTSTSGIYVVACSRHKHLAERISNGRRKA